AYPNLTQVVRTWFPFRERAFAQGGIWMSARLGGACAPLIIGRLSAALGWRQAFAVLGGVGIAWAVAFRLWFRDSPREHTACNHAERELIELGTRSAERGADNPERQAPSDAITTQAAVEGIQIAPDRPAEEALPTPRSAPRAGEGHAWPPLG